MTDAELVHRARAGDLVAFGRLVERHRGAVQGLAYHWTGRSADAEDIAQEAFITAYLKLAQLRDAARFAAWMRLLTLNHCRRWKERRKPMETLDEAEPAAPGPSPAEELERMEERDLVTRSLRRLSDNNRLVLTLHYLGDMGYSQIAHFLDLSVNAVAARMHRARKQLEESLMQTVSDSLRNEGLDDDFTRKVLEQAQSRAKETQSQWHRDAFLVSVEKGLEAARQLADDEAQIEMLSLLGDAGSSWLADSEKAVESYTAALDVARRNGDSAEVIRLLAALYSAHLRHGQWEFLHDRAAEALEACRAAGDLTGQAQAQAALDLAAELPDAWSPDEPGGYALAAFPIIGGPDGLAFDDLVAQRRYSWGCPSRCAALMHLYRPRRVLGPDLSLGCQWEDQVCREHDGMSWALRANEGELMARSQIESADDSVVVSAGRFVSCLKVITEIVPRGGGTAREYATRSYCGTRTAWFAHGVGLVKLRHIDQNHTEWLVQLTAHSEPHGEDYFPVDLGRHWQYEHAEGWKLENGFTDTCRVVTAGDGLTWLSSATWARRRSAAGVKEWLERRLDMERDADDEEEQIATLVSMARFTEDEEYASRCRRQQAEVLGRQLDRARTKGDLEAQSAALNRMAGCDLDGVQARACLEELADVSRRQGDGWGELTARQGLERLADEDRAGLETRFLREQLALAGDLGDPRRLDEALSRLAYHLLDNREYAEAARRFEEHAEAIATEGDVVRTAGSISWAELARALDADPDEASAYRHGDGHLIEKEGALESTGSSRIRHSQQFPPTPVRTPMTDLLWLTPFDGLMLLNGEVGESQTDWYTSSLAGISESMRKTCTLKSTQEEIEVAAGHFGTCALVESVICTSEEDRPVEYEELEVARGYFAGTKQVWFARGAGMVRLEYRHSNGFTTVAELVDYSVEDQADAYLPLALGNRWRYRWQDQESGVRFEDVLRVAAHGDDQWELAFVTSATPGPVAEKSLSS